MKRKSGITLIALVVTIIVLLILAGVSLTALTDEDKGVVKKAQKAAEETEQATENEEKEVDDILDYAESENWGEELPPPEDVSATKENYLIVNPCSNAVVADLFGNVGYGTFINNKRFYPVTALASELNNARVSFYAKEEGGEFEQVNFYLWVNNAVNGDAVTSMSLGGSYTNFVLELDPNKTYTIMAQFQEANGAIKYCLYGTNTVTFSYKNSSGSSVSKVVSVVNGTAVDEKDIPTPGYYEDVSYTYTFNKWVTTSGGTTQVNLNEITANTTVYAYYTSQIKESICFVAGTEVLTETGLVNIEDVKVGMKVYSYNEETQEVELKEVKQTFKTNPIKDMVKVTVNGEVVESTSKHEYYVVGKGWTAAHELKEGDVLLNSENEEIKVETVELIISNGNPVTVYNMEVEDNHNYFVGEENVLVHNAGSPC